MLKSVLLNPDEFRGFLVTQMKIEVPVHLQVWVSLERLNAGCIKTVEVERRRVAADGASQQVKKNVVHLVIRRGSQDGDRLVFEGEGEEAVDTTPGDLTIILRQKPNQFKRLGEHAGGGGPATQVACDKGRAALLAAQADVHAVSSCGCRHEGPDPVCWSGASWRPNVVERRMHHLRQPPAAPRLSLPAGSSSRWQWGKRPFCAPRARAF